MPLPGFTAEVSVGPTTQAYRVHDRYGTAGDGFLQAQSSAGDWGDSLEDGGMESGGVEDGDVEDEGLEDDDDSMDTAAEDDEMGDEV
jgi:hypothetical protein